ncbi:MAG TPA: O-antigen ligase family protein [Candidatus Limnocylindria bacterium]|jgi:O-antigen ligase|nr:O-antigen ligase family protein [Candidatus Limnocylindria bacterium]
MAVRAQALRGWQADRRASLLLLSVGLVLAMVAAYFAAQGHDRLTLLSAVGLPVAVLVVISPWTGILLWLAVVPFFVVGSTVAGPETWLLHRLFMPTLLGMALVYRIFGLSRSQFRLSAIDGVLVLFLVLSLANVQLYSANPARMTAAFYDRIAVPVLLYWLVRVMEPKEEQLRRLMWVFVVLIVVQTVVAAMSWVTPGLLPGQWLGRAGERAVGTVGGPGPYTVTIILGALFVVPFIRQYRADLSRWFLYGIVALAFVGVAISFSRGSWLGAALAFAGLLIFERHVATRLLAIFALGGALLLAGPFSGQLLFAADRLGDAETAESRLVTNAAAVRMISDRPLTGFGYGNFELYDESYKVRMGDLPAEEGSSHHTYLGLAAENGLPAFILYMLPMVILLVLTLRRWRAIQRGHPLYAQLLAVLWLAVLHQLVVTNFMDMLHSSPWGTGLWWLTLGLIHVLISIGSRPPEIRRVGWTVPETLKP